MDRSVLYFLQLTRRKPFTAEAIEAHVAHLRALDDAGQLVLAGPMADGPGGIVIISTEGGPPDALSADWWRARRG